MSLQHLKTRLSLIPLLAVLPSIVWAQAPVVDVGNAQYQGSFNGTSNITNFLGIRYAAPPTGDLRWQLPQAPPNISGVQLADTEPNTCLQASAGGSPTNPFPGDQTGLEKRAVESSEDCLFLNVHVPGSTIPTEKLPTIVWIHGGGYVGGSANAGEGQDIIMDSSHGVVSVSIQYRLGLFGFLPGSQVKANGTVNAGLFDQDFALRWVHDHIADFGGDPEQVTIWGESAGAGSVLQQVIAHGGQTEPQLFRAAMTSSTFLPSQYAFNDTIPEFLYNQTVSALNCSDSEDSLSCLRSADVAALQQANTNINAAGFQGTFVFVPVVDGEFIQQRATESLAQGKVNGNALLSVTNSFEGRVFVSTTFNGTAAEYANLLFPNFPEDQNDTVTSLYAPLGTNLDQAIAIQGETIFICPTYYILNAFNGSSFKAEFAVPPANHGQDVQYYFPSDGTPVFDDPDFVKAFSRIFPSFAISLDPNNKTEATITPEWPMFSSSDTEMLFNETDAGAPLVQTIQTDQALLERCSFWESIGAFTGQ